MNWRHYSGGLGIQNLSASHTASVEGNGQVVFESGCNVNASVVIRGNFTIVDNTAGMNNLTTNAMFDKRSQITTIASDVVLLYSDTAVIEAWGLGSVASDTAAVESELIVVHSETTVVQSDTTVIEAWGLSAVASDTARIESDLVIVGSDVVQVYSDTTIIASDLVQVYSDTTIATSDTAVIEGWGLSAVASDTAAIESELILVHSETTVIQSDTVVIEAWGLSAVASDTAVIEAAWTTALTESYAADGATFTPAQALYMIWSKMVEMGISGTTMTCKKLDGSTTSMTFTLDDGTTPTSITRAT